MIPDAAIAAAERAYRETLTELRLAEGGGFKVASQVRRALHAALEAAAPHMIPNYLDANLKFVAEEIANPLRST